VKGIREVPLSNTSSNYKFWNYNWMKRDQTDVIWFIISLFNAQHVSDVSTSILRSLWLICWVISWVVLFWHDMCWCYVVAWLGWCGIRTYLLSYLMGCIVLARCVLVLRCGLAGVVWYSDAGWSTSASTCIQIPHHPSQTTP
jgi:hypothetical protein